MTYIIQFFIIYIYILCCLCVFDLMFLIMCLNWYMCVCFYLCVCDSLFMMYVLSYYCMYYVIIIDLLFIINLFNYLFIIGLVINY